MNAVRSIHDAFAPAGARPLRWSPVGPADPALGRRARLFRSLDRRAPYRAMGAASLPRPADRAIVDGNQANPAGAGRLSAALPSPGRAGKPGGDARSHGAGSA